MKIWSRPVKALRPSYGTCTSGTASCLGEAVERRLSLQFVQHGTKGQAVMLHRNKEYDSANVRSKDRH